MRHIIHAFIILHLDFSNSILFGINSTTLAYLQLLQKAAARFLTGSKRWEHIIPILAGLHWLPVSFQMYFIMFLFKSRNGLASAYFADLLSPYVPCRSLRSADQHLTVKPFCCKSLGDRAFSVCVPTTTQNLIISIPHDF